MGCVVEQTGNRVSPMVWTEKDSILPPEFSVVWFMFEVGRGIRAKNDKFPPLFLWQNSDGQIGTTQLFYPMGGLPEAADDVLNRLNEESPDSEWFGVILDAYGRTMEPDETGPTHIDELGDMFSSGDPGVVEQLMALVAFNGDVRVWRQIYRNTNDGYEWNETEWIKRSIVSDAPLMGVLELHAMITAVRHNPTESSS